MNKAQRQQDLQSQLDRYRARLATARTLIAVNEEAAKHASFGILAVKRVAYKDGIALDEPA